MDITQVSIIHHVGIVLLVLWLLAEFNWCYPLAYFLSLIYLYLVHERYIMRLRKKVQFEERKQANQRRVLSDSETVRWLNHAVEKIWPICMEQIASQKILLPIVPWFLEKYKPWTAKKAMVQHLYLGRNPPIFTDMRILRQSNDDDHLVMELGMNFLTADDMSAILAVKLRKRLGFGMWARLHLTGMHIEGRVLIGVKFLRDWPYLGRLRLCFVEPPYFQMTVKPIFTHGLDVTELPGIAGWLDKLLSMAFEQTLVEPNMLVVDMEKFVSECAEDWFSVDEKEPIAFAKVEIVEASNMKPSDLNGFADPYVKGQLGSYRFKTKIQKKTLNPKWHEEFKIPIVNWESPNLLALEVRDKDHFVDDILGDCSVNINDLRGGQRHDMWLSLQNIKMGRLRLAVTILEENVQVDESQQGDWKSFNAEEKRETFATEASNKGSFSSVSSGKSPRVSDNFEPIDVEGQKQTGIWVHRPGSEVSQTWETRKGKTRRVDNRILREPNEANVISSSTANVPRSNNSSSTDENPDENQRIGSVRRGLRKIGSVFHRSPRETQSGSFTEPLPSPHVNIKAVNTREIGVKFVVDENLAVKIPKEEDSSNGDSGRESPAKGKMKDKAKSFFKHAEKSARSLRQVLSRKGSRRSSFDSPAANEQALSDNDNSSDDEPLPLEKVDTEPNACDGVVPNFVVETPRSLNHVVLQPGEIKTVIGAVSPKNKASPRGPETLPDKMDSPVSKNDGVSPKLKQEGRDFEEQAK